jgi:hypothetical protein
MISDISYIGLYEIACSIAKAWIQRYKHKSPPLFLLFLDFIQSSFEAHLYDKQYMRYYLGVNGLNSKWQSRYNCKYQTHH